jgi:hypothetical protein
MSLNFPVSEVVAIINDVHEISFRVSFLLCRAR